MQAGDLQKAEDICKKILRIVPHRVDAVQLLCLIAYRRGDLDAAASYLRKAIHLSPKNPDNYNNLGVILKGMGRIDEAIECFRNAIKYNENFINAHYNLGNALKTRGNFDDAVASYQTALRLDPKDSEAWNNLGNVLKEMGKLDEAISCYDKAVHINPNFALAYSNMGTVYQDHGLFDKAYEHYQKALSIDPKSSSALNNMGVAFREEGLLDEAMTYCDKAIAADNDDAEAYWNRGITCLIGGKFIEGWQNYEWRFRKKDVMVIERNISQPRWMGQDITGQTILLYAEQGLGDAVQFIRYAPLVAERGAHVVVECQKELVKLVQHVKGVGEVVQKGQKIPAVDVWCPLLSLPLLFSTTLDTIPANIPYLQVSQELKHAWEQKVLDDPAGFRVGIVWAGNPKYRHDRLRSCPLKLIAKLQNIKGIVFYSLQKDATTIPAQSFNHKIFIDYMDEVRDFSDTAALIENLDLVISVDTAVAHVAGALGKKVWTLLRSAPDWRWMLHRSDSPWYPTMRLFRQPKQGEWESVIDEVLIELQREISSPGV